MLSLIELTLLIAVFFTLRALSRWLKAYVAHVESKNLRMKALGLFAALLPFPAPGKTGVARHVFWVPAQLLVLIVIYVTYCMARIAYWDHEVRQLCAKDGGVEIYERIEISKEEAESLSRESGLINLPFKGQAKSTDFGYTEEEHINIKNATPKVIKHIGRIYRLSDHKLLAMRTAYGRSGGDAFGPWEGSSYGCPDGVAQTQSTQKIFLIK